MSASRNYLFLFVLLFGIGTAFSVNVNAGPVCGDGNVDTDTDPPETCDEGGDPIPDPFPQSNLCNNGEDVGDGPCQVTRCGDGNWTQTGANSEGITEQCDDGTANSDTTPDACRTDCTLPSCGDGVTDTGEECDDGAANSDTTPDACRTDCTTPSCGDGVVDTGEGCDDENVTNGDGCDSLCQVEDGWNCSGSPSVCSETDLCAGFTPEPTTCGVGECAATGETTCDPATGNTGDSCTPGTPSSEVCDGLDNDCDGTADNGIAPVPTTCGVGECAASGEETCVDGTPVDSCTPGTPSSEVCDGLDNDCNGAVDDDPSCTDLCAGFTPEPTTCGVGECAATGETTCDPATGNIGDSCTPGTPSSEVCDGLDNDCNGAVDDDPSCAAATVIIDGCDSGVPDPTGSITEGILNCDGNSRNHGQFVSCAAHFLNSLGLSSYDKDAIQSCVGSSDIGK